MIFLSIYLLELINAVEAVTPLVIRILEYVFQTMQKYEGKSV